MSSNDDNDEFASMWYDPEMFIFQCKWEKRGTIKEIDQNKQQNYIILNCVQIGQNWGPTRIRNHSQINCACAVRNLAFLFV